MTLEEAKYLADKGNVDAMVALANYYTTQKENDENAIDLAFEYYERAAMAGNMSASIKMAQLSRPLAKEALSNLESEGPLDILLTHIEIYHKWATILFNNARDNNVSGEIAEMAHESYIEAVVWQATVYFFKDDYTGILQVTENVNAPVAKALRGMAIFKLAETEAEFEMAFALLKNAEQVSFWKESYMNSRLSEMVLIETANILCNVYRIAHKDNEAAFNVLSIMYANANSTEMKKEIQEKLSKYRENRRGRHEYIG